MLGVKIRRPLELGAVLQLVRSLQTSRNACTFVGRSPQPANSLRKGLHGCSAGALTAAAGSRNRQQRVTFAAAAASSDAGPAASAGNAAAPGPAEPAPAASGPPQPPVKAKGSRVRLDALTLELYPQYSRTLVQSWIIQGKVLVNGAPITKTGASVSPTATIDITAIEPKFVCRAGFKLEAALDHFKVDVTGLTALDSGLSTGGFTDCLLQRGAVKVYGIDVGYGQVHEKIRQDERVVVMERTNVRHLPKLPEDVGILTLDLSFISVLKVIPAVRANLKPGGMAIVLIKPQFEAKKGQVGSNGVVRDPVVHQECIDKVVSGMSLMGFDCAGTIPSPIKGAKEGNTEFLSLFRYEQPGPLSAETLQELFGRRWDGGEAADGDSGSDEEQLSAPAAAAIGDDGPGGGEREAAGFGASASGAAGGGSPPPPQVRAGRVGSSLERGPTAPLASVTGVAGRSDDSGAAKKTKGRAGQGGKKKGR